MSNLMPYRTTRRPLARNDFGYLMDEFFRPFFSNGVSAAGELRVDVKDEGDHYLLEADLPGVAREDIHLDVEDGVLTISAETKAETEEKRENYVYSERRYGKMQRSFKLAGIQEDAIQAACENGVLKLTLPKQKDAKTARKIEIQ